MPALQEVYNIPFQRISPEILYTISSLFSTKTREYLIKNPKYPIYYFAVNVHFGLYTIFPSINTYSIFVDISNGLPSAITISASFPTSKEPTLSAIPICFAGLMVIA